MNHPNGIKKTVLFIKHQKEYNTWNKLQNKIKIIQQYIVEGQ